MSSSTRTYCWVFSLFLRVVVSPSSSPTGIDDGGSIFVDTATVGQESVAVPLSITYHIVLHDSTDTSYTNFV